MRILVIGRSFPEKNTGMLGVFEMDQALALKNKGNEVRYFFCDTRSIFRIQRIDKVDFEYQGIIVSGCYLPIGRLPYYLFSSIKTKVYLTHLKKVISDFMPEVIHIHYPSIVMTEAIWKYIRSLDAAIFATEHYTKIMTLQIPKRIRNLETCVLKESDGFICVSGRLRDSVENISNIKGKVLVLPNMVSGTFNIGKVSEDKDVIFTYVGAARKVKQIDKLLEAFCILLKTRADCRLRIIGDGPEIRKIKNLACKLGIINKVNFYGNVSRNDVAILLGETDYFITASCLETFCVPVVEAWCCGIPTIISDNIPLLNYANEDNAIVYRDSDIQDMADAMYKAIKNGPMYNQKKISDEAKHYFSSETISTKLMELYVQAVGRRKL